MSIKMKKALFKTMLYLVSASVVIFALSACGTKTTGPAPEVAIDLGSSSLYTQEELNTAILLIKDKFATFAGCELHSIRYAGDDANNKENLEWLNSLREVRSNIPPEDVGKQYVQVAEFLSNFHSPVEEGPYAWELDMEYKDYQWWLGRLEDGRWEIVSWGY